MRTAKLTIREWEVLAAIKDQHGHRIEAAQQLGIAADTIRTHIQNIYDKTGEDNLVGVYLTKGWLHE